MSRGVLIAGGLYSRGFPGKRPRATAPPLLVLTFALIRQGRRGRDRGSKLKLDDPGNPNCSLERTHHHTFFHEEETAPDPGHCLCRTCSGPYWRLADNSPVERNSWGAQTGILSGSSRVVRCFIEAALENSASMCALPSPTPLFQRGCWATRHHPRSNLGHTY